MFKRLHKKSKHVSSKPSWNSSFFTDGNSNLTEAHPYYKQYFDKPNNQTPDSRFRDMHYDTMVTLNRGFRNMLR